jgi:hypothetical protein
VVLELRTPSASHNDVRLLSCTYSTTNDVASLALCSKQPAPFLAWLVWLCFAFGACPQQHMCMCWLFTGILLFFHCNCCLVLLQLEMSYTLNNNGCTASIAWSPITMVTMLAWLTVMDLCHLPRARIQLVSILRIYVAGSFIATSRWYKTLWRQLPTHSFLQHI